MKVLRRSLRDEGPRFLFRGWTPAFIRLGPNTVLLFVFFEVGLSGQLEVMPSDFLSLKQLKKGWDAMAPEFP
jgi:dicarboxylate transporter 10